MSKCHTGGCGTQFNAAGPNTYVLSQLQDLDKGQSLAYTAGCAVGGQTCNNVDPGYKIYPDNGEFVGVSSNVPCKTCYNNHGCDYYGAHDPSSPCDCCCASGFPTQGTRCAVQRNDFIGQGTACCLQSTSAGKGGINAALTGLTGDIFNWYHMQNPEYINYTCDPNYRDGTDCGKVAPNIAFNCAWISKEGTRKAWTTGNPTPNDPIGYCTNFVNNYSNPGDNTTTNLILQSAVAALATNDTPQHKYSDFGVSQPENAPFIANILAGCKSKGQGSCDIGLSNLCALPRKDGVPWSRDDIFDFYSKYLTLQKKPNKTLEENNLQTAYANVFTACGCHLPKKDYAKWNKIGVDESNFSCDPLCMLPGVIRQYINGQEATCDQNLCILDNITIDILNSNVPGGITFTTICGDCGDNSNGGSGGCRCIFSGIDIFQSGSSVGNINFQQSCGGNCQIPDPNQEGNFIPINCQTGQPISGGGPQKPTTFTSVLKWLSDHAAIVIVLIVVFLVLIITIVWITQKEPHKHKGPGESVTLGDLFSDFDDYVAYY